MIIEHSPFFTEGELRKLAAYVGVTSADSGASIRRNGIKYRTLWNPMMNDDQMDWVLDKIREEKLTPYYLQELDYLLQPEGVLKRHRPYMHTITLCSQTLWDIHTCAPHYRLRAALNTIEEYEKYEEE